MPFNCQSELLIVTHMGTLRTHYILLALIYIIGYTLEIGTLLEL